jgi:hypothetical protein
VELISANKTGGRSVFIEGNARTIVERERDIETGEDLKHDRSSFVSMESELLTRINTNNHKKKSNTGLRAVTETLARKNRTIKLWRNRGIKEEMTRHVRQEEPEPNFLVTPLFVCSTTTDTHVEMRDDRHEFLGRGVRLDKTGTELIYSAVSSSS